MESAGPTPADILSAAGFDGPSFHPSDSSNRSMRGSCPKCGGSRRMLVFIDNPLPFWNYTCDLCGYKGSRLDKIDPQLNGTILFDFPDKDPSIELENLSRSKIWEVYHENLSPENREWLRKRGIPDLYQDIWQLGYTEARPFLWEGQIYRSPAYTVPKVNYDLQVVNIDYRLLDFPEGAGKYRSEQGLPPVPFIAAPQSADLDWLFIVEGAFKAMNLFLFLFDNNMPAQVIGLPSASSKAYRDHLDRYPNAFIMLDPDAVKTTRAIARDTGARPIYMPAKIDDAILDGLSWSSFMTVMDNSSL